MNKNYTNNRKNKNKKNVVKKKKLTMKNELPYVTYVNGGPLPLKRKGMPTVKIFDNNLTTITPSTTATIQGLFAPAQGVAITNRIGDIVYLRKMSVIYNCNAANADIFSQLRVVIFQWIPNNALIAPLATSIFQLAADHVYAMYDVNFQDQYRILYDKIHAFAGTSTNPSSSVNQTYSGNISLSSAFKRCAFTLGGITNSNSIYLLTVSDSGIVPFPTLNFKSRICFEEEV